MAEILVDGCDDDRHVGDAAVRDEDLGAVQDPLVAVNTAVVRSERTSDPALGSVTA